jgi:hypothetical protein
MRSFIGVAVVGLVSSIAFSGNVPVRAQTTPAPAPAARSANDLLNRMSASGRLARRAVQERFATTRRSGIQPSRAPGGGAFEKKRGGGPGPLEDGGELPGGNQGELAIATDDSGKTVIIGFNDFRGFGTPDAGGRISISGFSVSRDGGRTFVDGGQLPITVGDPASGLPLVFGDPDVKHLGGCDFIYSSIMVAPFGEGASVQTMGYHLTRDCAQSWQGPFEIPPASNPNGMVEEGFPVDAADKEFIDVDRATGRVLMSWTNFSNDLEISTTYSDNILSATPTWSPRLVLGARSIDGQGSIPRFGPPLPRKGKESAADGAEPGSQGGGHRGPPTVHVAWATFGENAGISVATSTDGGASFGPPVDLAGPANFFPDQVPGNDRIHAFPTLAVDRSRGPHRGTVYVSYLSNASRDGGDIAVQTSADRGKSFGAPVIVNARPGQDRSQWFPALATNDRDGRALLFYYDQGPAGSGDLTQTSYTFSDDGGQSWSAPRRFSPGTFHAGAGNDSSQPNLGDYNMAVVNRKGELLGAYATTRPMEFRDGQPGGRMSVPEPAVAIASAAQQDDVTTVDLQKATIRELDAHSDRNGFVDPGEKALVSLEIRNNVTNPASASPIAHPVAKIESRTPGVRVLLSTVVFPALAPGETRGSLFPAVLALKPDFVPGTDITLAIRVLSGNGLPMNLEATLHTGTPLPNVLLFETFDEVEAGALPASWQSVHGAGANTVPWTTRSGFCGSSSNAAFHVNADDGTSPNNHARWERLLGPTIVMPTDAAWVELEFDVCTDTEDDPSFNVQAFDGLFLRVFDGTAGGAPRSVLVEAFARDFTTGDSFHYPKHLPRSNNPAYFQDMSVWAGDSGGPRHVKMRLPGLAGATIQLRFEYTQDEIITCADLRPGRTCGVSVDNVKLTAFRAR